MSIFKKSAKYNPVKKIRKNNINSAFSTSNKRIDPEYDEANFKDENLIFYIMKELPGFFKYMKFNLLSDDNLKIAIPYLKHVHLKRGEYLYDESDFATEFYGIIRGKITTITKRTKNLYLEIRKKNVAYYDILDFIEKRRFETLLIKNAEQMQKTNSSNDYEGFEPQNYSGKGLSDNLLITSANCNSSESNDVKVFQKEGECFGDWEMINNNSKTTIAFASEDADLFVLEKDYFMDYFSKPIIKSENERKLFIKKIIHPLTNYGFDDFYNKITPIFLEQHETVYYQGSIGEYIYLIFSGSCLLQKCINKKIQTVKDSEQETAKKPNFYDILHLSRGGIAGLEVVYYADQRYQYTMKSEENNTILFKIKREEVKKDPRVKEYLKSIFIEQEKIMKTYLQKHVEIKKIYRPSYKSKDLNSNNKTNILDGVLKNCINESLGRNKLLSHGRGKNEMRVTSCKLRLDQSLKNTECEYSSIYLKESFDLTSNNNISIKENSVMQKLSEKFAVKVPQSANNNRRSELNKGGSLPFASSEANINFDNTTTNLKRTSMAYPGERDKALKRIKSGSICLSRNSSALTPKFSICYGVNNERKNFNAVKLQSKEGTTVGLNFKNGSLVNFNYLKNSDLIKEEEEKQILNRPMSVGKKFRIDPLISKSANKWVNYKKSLMPKYSTGHFNLPLVSKHVY